MPTVKPRINVTVDENLYNQTKLLASLYGVSMSELLLHLLRSASVHFPPLIHTLQSKKQLDEVTILSCLKLLPQFHLELWGGDSSGKCPRPSNTGAKLGKTVKIHH